MGRKRITDPKSSTSQLLEAVGLLDYQLPKSGEVSKDQKAFLRDKGMKVYKKEELSKKCYLCKSQGSLDNQLIPRWISKETMVSVCAGCYERSVGWVKVDNAVKIIDFNIGKDFLSLSGVLQNTAWKAETSAVLNTPKR